MKSISFLETKPPQDYKGIRIKADTGLHDQIEAMVKDRLKKGARVLDLGAGEGALSQRFADLGYRVLAADADDRSFKAHVPFVRIDFNDEKAMRSFKRRHAGSFDLVLGVEVIEHLENPWQYLRDLQGLARSRGQILLSTPNVTSWYSRLLFLLSGRFHQFEDHDRAYGHINPVAEDELRWICRSLGLEVVELKPGGWLPRVWLSRDRRLMIRNLFGFLLSFLMKGTKEGWCVLALLRKNGGKA